MINDNHRTLLHQIADAVARTDHPTSISVHPLLEDYLPHADAALEALADHLDTLERETGRHFTDDPWEHGYYRALSDIREQGGIRAYDTSDPAAEDEAHALRAEAMNEHMNDFKHEEDP